MNQTRLQEYIVPTYLHHFDTFTLTHETINIKWDGERRIASFSYKINTREATSHLTITPFDIFSGGELV